MNEVNTKLKKLLIDINMPHNQFAKQLGITPQTFSAKINGKMSFTVRQYKTMAEYLGVTIDEII